jgi:hypothetical protein
MGVIITFDPIAWAQIYPEFSYLSSTQATNYFNMATAVHANDGSGPVNNTTLQTTLLYSLTAHFAALYAPSAGGQAATPLVGRISSAQEGSVNVQTELASNISMNQAWFCQTKYGMTYWQMTAKYRTMNYVPGRTRNFNAPFPWLR